MKEALLNRRWVRDITGAPIVPVLCDYIQVWEAAENIILNQFEADRFIWRWTANGEYSASLAYRSFFIGMTSLQGAKEVWRAAVSFSGWPFTSGYGRRSKGSAMDFRFRMKRCAIRRMKRSLASFQVALCRNICFCIIA